MKFASYFHDPDNLFVPLLEKADIPDVLKEIPLPVSPETTLQSYELIKKHGFRVVEGGHYGYAKVKALKESLANNGSDYFMICDFDKMLHWLETDREELLQTLNTIPENDITAVARSAKALETYPLAWVETEMIVTRIIGKTLGKNVDVMNGPYILSRKAAEIIAEEAKETGVGACTEWALIGHKHGLSIGNLEVNGLTWEDPDRYQEAIDSAENFDAWKDKAFDSLYEWRKRVEFLHKQVSVMIRLNEEPVNPKYPFVHNKTFK